MRRALIGSIAAHAGIAAMWVCVPHEATVARSEPTIAVTIVEPAPPVPVPSPSRGGGGGGGAKARSAPHARVATRSIAAPELEVHMDRGGGGGAGHGSGGGFGDGLGDGSGPGIGGGITRSGFSGALPEPPPPPAPPPISKARPPRLIYPSHHADAGDDTPPFIARVTVDTDGYVVGARLVTGTDRARAGVAATAIWRFRYAPALDDAGRAVSATVDQDFLLE